MWHVLTHSAGLPAWEQPVTLEDVYDVPKATGYHSIMQGTITSEFMRRMTGKRAREFIAEEMAGSLEADFQLGRGGERLAAHWEMLAPPAPPDFNPNSLAARCDFSGYADGFA